jgi:hypothetical protein
VLRIANVTFVRRDGAKASRLRLFWRALVAWSPFGLAMVVFALWHRTNPVFGATLGFATISALALLSLALPRRGLPDRLAGTWPVPR